MIQMARFSHADCQHPSTKVARAACRRTLAKTAANMLATVDAAPVETPAPVESVTVTRENWREFKGQTITAILTGERVVEGNVTGWSANLLQVKGEKVVRIPVAEIESVTV
jgi:hypothetical protein